MAAVVHAGEVPTLTDAAAAAEALVAGGAEEVLVFGSVARGEAGEGSDIDLVALFADIDYSQRLHLKRRLEEAAGDAVGRWPVQVVVTDRPEWRARVENVSSSFERRISSDAVAVAASTVRAAVRWDKEMVRPMSNPAEALRYFEDGVLTRFSELRDSTRSSVDEDDDLLEPQEREVERLRRMVRVCENSAVAVELALKALAVLHGAPVASEGVLRPAGHDIGKCLDLLPEPQRGAVAVVVGDLGLDLRTMSRWRVRATYPGDIDTERALADRLVEDYINTALAVCEFTIGNIADQLGDTPAMRRATVEWRRQAAFIVARNVRSGLPRDQAP
ncbi:MAG: nucleotidyltransferase domain-containing protein [bacterium]|nr:nucleotidyltransferase domain-containing protein [bacterium]